MNRDGAGPRRLTHLDVAMLASVTGDSAKALYKRAPTIPGFEKQGGRIRFKTVELVRAGWLSEEWLPRPGEDGRKVRRSPGPSIHTITNR